jgi:N-acetylglucosamine-6-phosphate deacetylase
VGVTTVLAAAGVCPPGEPRDGWIAIADGRVVEVAHGRAPRGAVDLGDSILAPGYVDLQVNGVNDIDFASAGADDWRRASDVLLEHGVTAYCPTFVSAPLGRYAALLGSAANARIATGDDVHAAVLGAHLEGPFLGGAPGAHPTELLRPVDWSWLDALLTTPGRGVNIVTLAPEADPGLTATRRLTQAGVVVALGHSTATYDEARAAADAGASVVTHLFNGMSPLHHREPGLVGAALDDERLVPTLIADLVHVHPALIRLVVARKAKLALVSDVVGLRGGLAAIDGAARLPDGRLAGATVLLDQAVANVVGLGVAIARAIELATTVPADILGLDDRGRLEPGARADVVALDPVSLRVRATWVGGHGRRSTVST